MQIWRLPYRKQVILPIEDGAFWTGWNKDRKIMLKKATKYVLQIDYFKMFRPTKLLFVISFTPCNHPIPHLRSEYVYSNLAHRRC